MSKDDKIDKIDPLVVKIDGYEVEPRLYRKYERR